MFSVRGAITIDVDTKDEILCNTRELMERILEANSISKEDIVTIIFTCTKDIKASYPAPAARDMGIVYAGLLCLQEMYVENSLEKCIRILMMVNEEKNQKNVKHVYLKGATKLRPDIMQDFDKLY